MRDELYLYHYYDRRSRPFLNLSDVPFGKAVAAMEHIKRSRPDSQCAQRDELYVLKRMNCENIVRGEFEKIGGRIERAAPHYMVVGHSPWLYSWYEQPAFICIPISRFDERTISFTYGDSMPTFSPTVNDGREYRHRLYGSGGIRELITKYGLPQDWNNDGKHGPERYIEACVWSDRTIGEYIRQWASSQYQNQ